MCVSDAAKSPNFDTHEEGRKPPAHDLGEWLTLLVHVVPLLLVTFGRTIWRYSRYLSHVCIDEEEGDAVQGGRQGGHGES